MTDLIIDTNSLGEILDNGSILSSIIGNHDAVYVPRCVIRNEYPRVYSGSPYLQLNIGRSIEKLEHERPSLFHVINPHEDIPQDLRKELRKRGVEPCDIEVIKLCKERKKKTRDVKIITTNERHFQNISKLRRHCSMIAPEKYSANSTSSFAS